MFFCPHCEEEVSKTFFQHKKRFYNPATGKWQNNECQDDLEETLHISILVLLLKVQIMVSIIVLILLLLELFQRLSLMHSVMKMRTTFKTEAAALETNLIVID